VGGDKLFVDYAGDTVPVFGGRHVADRACHRPTPPMIEH
jgi:hypothetical protein